MASVQHTNAPHRLRLPVVAAIVLTTLATAMGGASAQSPAGTPSQEPRMLGASSAARPSPQSSIPGFLLDRGRYTAFEVAAAVTQTFAGGINDRGQIVGYYDDASGLHGFLRHKDGRFSTIDFPGARATEALKINNRGQIVGVYSETSPFEFADGRGFLLDRGRFTRIDFPGAVTTVARGLNDRGQVVGDYTDAEGMIHGFLWDKEQFTTIDVPDAAATSLTDINDRGQIIGVHAHDPTGATGLHGFLLSRGVYTTFDAPDALVTQPFDINNRGQIVGNTISDLAETTPRAFLLAKGVKGGLHPDRLPGRGEHSGLRPQRPGPDHGNLHEPRRRAGWSAGPHADADDEDHDVGPLTAGPEVPA
jgi:hypothetical protein